MGKGKLRKHTSEYTSHSYDFVNKGSPVFVSSTWGTFRKTLSLSDGLCVGDFEEHTVGILDEFHFGVCGLDN